MNFEPELAGLLAGHGRLMAPVRDISKPGLPALDVGTVDAHYAARHPNVVQGTSTSPKVRSRKRTSVRVSG
ncbi:MAG: hypothetical protein ACREFP_24535 [Acetobacteraceae bacterium]